MGSRESQVGLFSIAPSVRQQLSGAGGLPGAWRTFEAGSGMRPSPAACVRRWTGDRTAQRVRKFRSVRTCRFPGLAVRDSVGPASSARLPGRR